MTMYSALHYAAKAEKAAQRAEDYSNPNWGFVQGDINNQADLMQKFDTIDDKIKEIELFKFPNADIIGEPIIQSGQVSGFSTVSYLQFPFIFDLRDQAFQIDFSFTTATNVQTQQNILDSKFGIALAIANGKGLMAISSNGTSWNVGQAVGNINIQSNTTYYARLIWNKLQYKTLLSTDGVNYTEDMVLTGAVRPYPRTIFIGGCDLLETGHDPHPFLGTINLNRAYLYVNNNLIWQGMDDAGLATRADVSLSNLDSEGQAKFDAKLDKSTITNCITEIPQDIKLELDNGTLTLKAGSKVYDGNGLITTTSEDKPCPTAYYNGQVTLVWLTNLRRIATALMGETVSSLPAATGSSKCVYNSTDKKCYCDFDSTWYESSFPLGLFTSTTSEFTSIDQVFNGFGYIGSTVFALPGVKGLIPNGRNADGTLKNIEARTDSVITYTNINTANRWYSFKSPVNGIWTAIDYKSDESLRIGTQSSSWFFDENANYWMFSGNKSYNWLDFAHSNIGIASPFTITSFTPKTAFHAVDYNDAALKEQFQVVTALPANPTPGVFYFVVE